MFLADSLGGSLEQFAVIFYEAYCTCHCPMSPGVQTLSNLVLQLLLLGAGFAFGCGFIVMRGRLLMNQYQLFIYEGMRRVRAFINENYTVGGTRDYFTAALLILFFLLLVYNWFGLLPYTLAMTGHFAVTFGYASLFFGWLNFVGVLYHGVGLFALFLPQGTPFVIIPLLVIIETISYVARVFSLSIRLFANITAGHILVKIIGGFVFSLVGFVVIGFVGWLLLCGLWSLEFFIGTLQAYVFVVLLCLYIADVLVPH